MILKLNKEKKEEVKNDDYEKIRSHQKFMK